MQGQGYYAVSLHKSADPAAILIAIAVCRKEGKAMLVSLKRFIREEDGIGTVEMILILVVLIGLVLIFKSQLTDLVESIFKTINNKAKQV